MRLKKAPILRNRQILWLYLIKVEWPHCIKLRHHKGKRGTEAYTWILQQCSIVGQLAYQKLYTATTCQAKRFLALLLHGKGPYLAEQEQHLKSSLSEHPCNKKVRDSSCAVHSSFWRASSAFDVYKKREGERSRQHLFMYCMVLLG